MLNITKENKDTTLIISLSGIIDANTAQELNKELKASLEGIKGLIFDFSEV